MDEPRTQPLSNGVQMPRVAFGCAFGDWVGRSTFQGFLPEQAWRAFRHALDAGYRAFDGAHAYATERILGASLGPRFTSGEFSRDQLFITTKLAHPDVDPSVNISHLRTWNAEDVPDVGQRMRDDLARTLDDLGMGYVDLCLIHWPATFGAVNHAFARRARAEMWEAMIGFLDKGAARAIGVANFSVRHLSELAQDFPDRPPMVNQVEIHPYCRDPQLEAYCAEHGIVLSAYAPFASGAFDIFSDPTLNDIAKAHGITVGQVILRWHLQQGRTVLPKSTNAARMAQNLNLFDVHLRAEEMEAIDALAPEEPKRTCAAPDALP